MFAAFNLSSSVHLYCMYVISHHGMGFAVSLCAGGEQAWSCTENLLWNNMGGLLAFLSSYYGQSLLREVGRASVFSVGIAWPL